MEHLPIEFFKTTLTDTTIAITLSDALGFSPLMLAIPITISTSLAFMLPVATPPNAIVFGTNQIKIKDMVKAGFWLNVISIIVVTLMTLYYLPLLPIVK